MNLKIIFSTEHAITANITLNNEKWVLTIVYGSPQLAMRKSLWSLIDMLVGNFERLNMPWVLASDFNEITSFYEKIGGNMTFFNTGFGNCVRHNALIDLGFKGSQFT